MKDLLRNLALNARDEGVLKTIIQMGNPATRFWTLDNRNTPDTLWHTLLRDKDSMVQARAKTRQDIGEDAWFWMF